MVKITKLQKRMLNASRKPRAPRAPGVKSYNAPAAFGEITRNSKPRFSHGADGSLVLNHTEFIGNVTTDPSNQFAYDVYSLDPANVTSFPWGSAIMELFETGELEELEVVFKSIAATSFTGAVEIGIDYDANDDDTTVTERELMNWEDSKEANIWLSFSHKSKRSNLQKYSKQRFVNDDGGSARFFSFGNIFVATTTTNAATATTPGPYASVTLGHLYFRYQMRLRTPQLTGVGTLSAGARPSQAQVLNKYSVVPAIASTGNVLAGIDPVSVPVIVAKEEQTDIAIELAEANQYLLEGTSGTFLAAGTPVLRFLKDVQGTMTYAADTMATLATFAFPTVSQYSAANAGATGSTQRPDLSQNVFDVLSSTGITTAGVAQYSFLARIVANAETVWRISMPLYTALAGMNKYLGVNFGTRLGSRKPNGDLVDAKEARRNEIAISRFNRPSTTSSTSSKIVNVE